MKTKKRKPTKKAKKNAKSNQAQTRSKATCTHIAERTRLFVLAGRSTKAQFIKVYGPSDQR